MKILFYIVFSIYLSACSVIFPGTNTGNPSAVPSDNASSPISSYSILNLAYEICSKINACYTSANTQTCYNQVIALNLYTSELGPTGSSYSTINEIRTAEINSNISLNSTNYLICSQAINTLSCGDTLVMNAFSSFVPTEYSSTKILFRSTTACAQIY